MQISNYIVRNILGLEILNLLELEICKFANIQI
jgi:hypothetical protein